MICLNQIRVKATSTNNHQWPDFSVENAMPHGISGSYRSPPQSEHEVMGTIFILLDR